MEKKTITIDGPAGSGLCTVSRFLSKKLNLLYLDTGAMYRAVAFQAKRENIDFNDGERLWELCQKIDLNFKIEGDDIKLFIGDEDISLAIRTPEMDMLASDVSAVQEVRDAMKQLQRKIGKQGGLVAEGRDMGTVVFPDADHKFFLTASPETRAERRYKERANRGESVAIGDVEKEILKRDRQDTTRSIAPLRPAPDAKVIDTTSLSFDEVVKTLLANILSSD